MKIAAGLILMGLIALEAQAEGIEGLDETRAVVVCMDGTGSQVLKAQAIASGIFAEIGVHLDWRGSCSPHDDVIRITWAGYPAEMNHPGALAFALPYEGTHIQIFSRRLWKAGGYAPEAMLAHVLAHEIAHILQAVSRHSESGIMKSHWDPRDIGQMSQQPLSFTALDVILIRDGLKERSARLVARKSTPQK